MAHHRVLHVQRGFRMSETYAKQVMADHCSIVWVEKGVSIRDATEEEMYSLRAQQNAQQRLREMESGILGRNDLPGITFVPPKTTSYRPPREAYEGMESPLGVRVCRWPRPMRAA